MNVERKLTADRGDAGQRIDLVVRRHLNDLHDATRTRIQAWIENGLVTVNGVAVRRTASRAALGDVMTVTLPETARRAVMGAEALGLDILHEDDHLMAVDKAAGMVVHPTHKHATGTVMNALLWHARDWPPGQRPSLVNRLDKLTSGVVIVAKTRVAHAALQRLMTSARSDKHYLALVYGRVNVASGRIALRLQRAPSDHRKVIASTTSGAPSVTLFDRLARVAAPRSGLTLLRCHLATGRTHQIRVHLAARGWPLVGDPVYGTPRWTQVEDQALRVALAGFSRQALHAWQVSFPHPATGRPLVLEAPLPDDLRRLLTACRLAAGLDQRALDVEARYSDGQASGPDRSPAFPR